MQCYGLLIISNIRFSHLLGMPYMSRIQFEGCMFECQMGTCWCQQNNTPSGRLMGYRSHIQKNLQMQQVCNKFHCFVNCNKRETWSSRITDFIYASMGNPQLSFTSTPRLTFQPSLAGGCLAAKFDQLEALFLWVLHILLGSRLSAHPPNAVEI